MAKMAKMTKLRSFRFSPGPGQETTVVVGEGALGRLSRELPRIAPGKWFVVSSQPVLFLHGERLLREAGDAELDPKPVLVPDGEAAKSWHILGRILEELIARGLRRDGGVIALGGGTVGDVGGLAASLVLRGVPIVQVPTTLLAASDSALGGKTAVDLPAGKNMVGTLHHPRLVVVDPALLRTLPDRDFRSGLTEVVKSAMLDASFFRRMPALLRPLKERRHPAVAEAVFRSLRMKGRVVASDPEEQRGLRIALNLGHTVGHALEQASGHRLSHGEAVAWGLLAALVLSERRGGLDPLLSGRLFEWVLSLAEPPSLSRMRISTWLDFLKADKKGDRRGLRAIVLVAPGKTATIRCEAGEAADAFQEARRRYNMTRDG
jgi:3-dehydroquinate synthetase